MANPPGSSLGWVKIDPHVEVSSPEWRTITPSGRDRQVHVGGPSQWKLTKGAYSGVFGGRLSD